MIEIFDPVVFVRELLADLGVSANVISWLSTVMMVTIVGLLAWLADIIVKAIVLKIVTVWVKRSKSEYDDKFLETRVFHRLSHLAPAIVVFYMASWALKTNVFWLTFVHKTSAIYMVIVSVWAINAFIEAWYRIYLMLPISQGRSIKGYAQLGRIIAGIIGSLIIVSILFKLDIGKIVTGLGAVAAVLILVFKDTILGLVASVQLSSNKMLRLGDWITITDRNIDGNVIDMSLHTVKIQNFDNTISTIPTYTLVAESFQNWKGMEESGVRRIKRAILIDIRSVTFINPEMAGRLKGNPLMDDFFKEHSAEIEKLMNGGFTTLTNIGAYRAFMKKYLENNDNIDKGRSIIVRNLSPLETGMPVEIYAFCKINEWVPYEDIQSAIFDYALAVLGIFDLRVFQNLSGADFDKIRK